MKRFLHRQRLALSEHSKRSPEAEDAVRIFGANVNFSAEEACASDVPPRPKSTNGACRLLGNSTKKLPRCFSTKRFERCKYPHTTGFSVGYISRVFSAGMTGSATMRVTSAESSQSSVTVKKARTR